MSLALVFAAALMGQSAPVYVAQGPTDCPRTDYERDMPEAQHQVFCFVGWVYGPGVMETIRPLGDDAPRVFTQGTVAAMAAARARPQEGDSQAAFDADPVCNCQDPGGLRLISLAVPEWTQDRAVAHINFDFGAGTETVDTEQVRRQRLTLRREPDGWRIEDITDMDGQGSFLASLGAQTD